MVKPVLKSKQLALNEKQMRDMGRKVIDLVVEHFLDLPKKKPTRMAARSRMERLFRAPIPRRGMPFAKVLRDVETKVLQNIMHLDHPRFFAFVSSPSNFVSVLADTLASGHNVFAGTWLEASGPAQIELIVLDWLKTECGMPKNAGGIFVSGGSMANLTALATARSIRLPEQWWKGTIYFSDQTHSSIKRALKVLGFSDRSIREIPSNSAFEISIEDLKKTISEDKQAGMIPFCIVANAGSTNTGSIDPLRPLHTLCKKERMWLHIDGAYGAAAILSREGKSLLSGLELADSLSLDPHKWMFQPYQIGCLLVKDRNWLKTAFEIIPEYLRDTDLGEAEVNFCNYGVELTRSFRALKLWMSLKVFGADSFRDAIVYGMSLARQVEQILGKMDDWTIVTPAKMGIINFRYAPSHLKEEQLDRINREIVARNLESGFSMIASTVLQKKTVMRMCTINPRTTERDIAETLKRLDRIARKAS